MSSEDDAILAEYVKRFGDRRPFESLEDLFTSAEGFGLVTATPLQRAICRIAEGRQLGELGTHPAVLRALDTSAANIAKLAGDRPAQLDLLSGIRTAKSMFAAALALWATQTCDMEGLSEGEIPRVSVVSIRKDLAGVIFSHLVGNIMARPRLRHLLVGEPSSDAMMLRHPGGRLVEIKVVSGARAGSSLVARWSAGVIFDEAPRMVGSDEGVVNLDDARTAVRGRLRPGAQLVEIGSPWAPFGPVYNTVQEHEGKPSKDIVVIRAPGPDMNPYWWTKERCATIERTDPAAYQTDVRAKFADIEESLFPGAILDPNIRESPEVIPFEPGHDYAASMDPATRGNAWTLTIGDRCGEKKRIVSAREWIGSPLKPLRPKEVLKEAAEECKKYGLDWCYTDQWSADANADLAEEFGLTLIIESWTRQNKVNAFNSLAVNLAEGLVELPPGKNVRKDLNLIKRRATQDGVTIVLPKTTDGRHCDYGPSVARTLFRWLEEDKDDNEPEIGTADHDRWEEKRQIQREIEDLQEEQDSEWWETQDE